MDSEQFRDFGKAAVDFIADYMDSLRDRHVLPSIKPGYLKDMLPDEAPENPEPWQDFLKDVERVIVPGMTHWHSPQFHAFYPTANSYPGIVGEMLSAGFASIGFSWLSDPACTELEVQMMNWLGKLLELPKEFLNCSEGPGGGVIQGSASESTFVGLLAAKKRIVNRMKKDNPDLDEGLIRSKLVAYTSEDSNSSVEKAGLLGDVPMRLLPSDENCSLRADTLIKAMEDDRAKGLIPFYVVANLGTTGTCGFDHLEDIGHVCQREEIWLHVDAAYAGAAFICPEYRHLMKGVELSDSFNFNPHKWMLVNFDCSAMWVKDANYLIDAFDVQRIYLADNKSQSVPDYRHWQIPLGRRFRSLKLWAVLRIYGASGIRDHIRKQISLAESFSNLVLKDDRFEIISVSMGLVCFRLKGEDDLSKSLLDKLMERKNIFLISCRYKTKYILRFVVCSRLCEMMDIEFAWNEIQSQTDVVFEELKPKKPEIIAKMDTADMVNSGRISKPLKTFEKTK